jgi:hypothetical protein
MRGWVLIWVIVAMAIIAAAQRCEAHDVPVELPPPQSVAEAWNVIEQSKANMDDLLQANLMRDVAAQLANISGALRMLQADAGNDETGNAIRDRAGQLMTDESNLLRLSRVAVDARSQTQTAWATWCQSLKELEKSYPAATVRSEVYICPMHPLDRHLKADEKCSICGMSLVRRHLPASGVYQKPGESTLKMTVQSAPLRVGQQAMVCIQLTKPDGSPVRLDDLIETHTKKIHMLINDASLSDYHHEHPQPTDIAGQYAFAFTPTKPGPYRIWADVVPMATGLQEYVIADLLADTAALPIIDRTARLTGELNGRRYELKFDTQGKPKVVNQVVVGTVSVSDVDGKGFTGLEPIMGAFAHLVAFNEDGKTILHIHPYSRTPTGPNDRAGPAFAFKFYAPMAGFYRLYCQVQIGGEPQFVPFGLTVQPGENKK